MSVLESWGDLPPCMDSYESNEVVDFIESIMGDCGDVIARFRPAPSVEKPAMMAIWPNRAAYDAGDSKRLRGKPGRMFRRMFPGATPEAVERFSNWYSERYAGESFDLHVSDDADAFNFAYTAERAAYMNPAITDGRKSLANSCMHKDFDTLHHPCEAYASGDFDIVYLTNTDDEVAGRCVVRKSPCVAGPIYGVSETALDQIENYLLSRGASLFGDGSWIGARLDRIEYGDGGFIAPYLDVSPQSLTDDGEYLVIDRHGDIDASDCSGVLNGGQQCADCGCRIHPDESYTDPNGWAGLFCEDCYHERYEYCGHCGEDVNADSIVPYQTRSGTEYCCDSCRDGIATETESDGWWHNDDVMIAADGTIISPDEYDDDYFTSDWDGEIYHDTERCETADGDTVSRGELSDDWQLMDDGTWHDVQLKPELIA